MQTPTPNNPTDQWPSLEPKPAPAPAVKARILLMDDEPSIRKLGSALLKRFGFAVTAVVDGTEALAAFNEARAAGEPFDLAILDLNVPGGLGGEETIDRLRRIDPAVKALVSSGYGGDSAVTHFRAHGFCGVVSKPYELADLLKAIDVALKGE